MRLILRLLANMGALAVATWVLRDITLTAESIRGKALALLLVALIFGIINAVLKPIFTFFTAVIVLLTLGLFLIVINACLLLLTSWLAGKFDIGWHVEGFWTAVLGSIIISIISFVLNAFIPDKGESRRARA